jgi:hypothetical protein
MRALPERSPRCSLSLCWRSAVPAMKGSASGSDPHTREPVAADRPAPGRCEVYDPAAHERPAIVDAHDN